MSSIPITNIAQLKETIICLLQAIKYKANQSKMCGGLKVIRLLMGMHVGFTKHCCFLCYCDSCAGDDYYETYE